MITLNADDLKLLKPNELDTYYAYMLGEVKASNDWREWLGAFAKNYTGYEFAPHHVQFWEWIYTVETNSRAKPFIGIWPRGGAKSTSVELGVVNLGARDIKKYVLYVSETQDQADTHVANIAGLIESRALGIAYKGMGDRLVGKFGNVKAWRRNRLRTASGFTVDALGLDTAARGIKLDEYRPDTIVLDDIDGELDTPATTEKKVKIITTALLPAGSENLAVIGIQNLIHMDGVFAQLADGRADWLSDRIVSGPIPALLDFAYDDVGGRAVITSGKPTWEGQGVERCQAMIDDWGISAFLSEAQQDTEPPEGGMFSMVKFKHIALDDLPDLVKTVVWVDPAVTSTDKSDCQAVQASGIDTNGEIYHIRSFEQRSTPELVVKKAIEWAVELGAQEVGIETDQGGDTWKAVYREAVKSLGLSMDEAPKFREAKAGSVGPKVERAGKMLADYERGRITHVLGTHQTLERALRRFPVMKPYDLTDAAYWAWAALRPQKKKRMINR